MNSLRNPGSVESVESPGDRRADLTTSAETASSGQTILDAFNIVLRNRKLIAAISLLGGALFLLVALLLPPTYLATTTFVPDVGSSQNRLAGLSGLGGLAGLAGQFGVTLGGDASKSPRFYADLVKSREVMENVLLTRFPLPTSSGDSASLLTIMGTHGRDSLDRLQRGTKTLARNVAAQVNSQTGIVELKVETKDPVLSALVAARFVDLLNEFNAHTRQTHARERRRFVEERVADGERNLRQAEDLLRQFYEKNRSWQQAPQLVFEEGRLRRQVEVQQELYLTLRREYETARIEEVNDTPAITVIDRAAPPRRRSEPNIFLLTTLGVFLGALLSILGAWGTEYAARLRVANSPAYGEFRKLIVGARDDLLALTGRRR